jgi:hypothetical protein
MTLSANRAERHPNTPDTVPERIVVRTTYGPVTNEVTEDIGHVKHFHEQLGRLIAELEGGGE